MENGETSNHYYTYDPEFHEIVSNPPVLRQTLEKFLTNMIDEITLGIVFDEHRKIKINGFSTNCDDIPVTHEQNELILAQNRGGAVEFFSCPKCDQPFSSFNFTAHLEKCMGIQPKGRLRKSTRRSTSNSGSNKDRESPAPTINLTSDDDDDGVNRDDDEWRPGKKGSGGKRGRERSRSKRRRAGSRKGSDSGESVDVDTESTTSSMSDFRGDFMNGLSPSPTSSILSTESEKRKREPSRSRRNYKK